MQPSRTVTRSKPGFFRLTDDHSNFLSNCRALIFLTFISCSWLGKPTAVKWATKALFIWRNVVPGKRGKRGKRGNPPSPFETGKVRVTNRSRQVSLLRILPWYSIEQRPVPDYPRWRAAQLSRDLARPCGTELSPGVLQRREGCDPHLPLRGTSSADLHGKEKPFKCTQSAKDTLNISLAKAFSFFLRSMSSDGSIFLSIKRK